MDFSLLEKKVANYGQNGYFLLESFVISLLESEAERNNQPLIHTNNKKNINYDYFAPNGILNITGPTGIEFVRLLISANHLLKIHHKLASQQENLLIISIGSDFKTNSSINFMHHPLPQNVFLWGRSEIQNLIDRNPELANKIAKNLLSNRLKVATKSESENWKEKRDSTIEAVKENYQSGRFSIFLGAGVSSSAGLPDWNTLLNSLFVSMLTDDETEEKTTSEDNISSIVKRLRQIDSPSALILARYIRKGISADAQQGESQFIHAVTKQLYELRNKRYSIQSPLIRSIADLCAPSRTGAKVRAVINYNFDDLIEREIESRGFHFKSIFEEIDLASPDELPIYHVHGFLPEDRKKYQNIEKSILVFSEEGYHQIYRDSYHWSNLTQLSNLKENSCLMIGLSLSDPNLRRLLEISVKTSDKPKHFAFMRRINYETFTTEQGKHVVRGSPSTIKNFLEKHHRLNEEVTRELGINIIWYENHEEIPLLIKRITSSRSHQ